MNPYGGAVTATVTAPALAFMGVAHVWSVAVLGIGLLFMVASVFKMARRRRYRP
jgi:hypothetical protein